MGAVLKTPMIRGAIILGGPFILSIQPGYGSHLAQVTVKYSRIIIYIMYFYTRNTISKFIEVIINRF